MKEFQISKYQKGLNKSILAKHILMEIWQLHAFEKKCKRSISHSAFIWRNHTGYKIYTCQNLLITQMQSLWVKICDSVLHTVLFMASLSEEAS